LEIAIKVDVGPFSFWMRKPLGVKARCGIMNAFSLIIESKDMSVGFLTCSFYICPLVHET